MQRHLFRTVAYAAFAAAVALSPIVGCSMGGLTGGSAFGGNRLQVAEINDIGDYTEDRALSEARAHFRNNDFGYSAALYKRVVELAPNKAEGYVGLGASYDRLQRFDLSDRVYEALYKLSGGTVQYFNNVGYSYLLRGNVSAAMTNFRKAKAIDPDNVVVANNMQIVANAASGRA